MQTNVKLPPNSLTSPTQPLPTSNTSLGQLSLLEFQKKFVPLPTLERVIFARSSYFLIYCLTNISIIMGKVTSLYGKTMGKIGSIVFSTSGGFTIAREYNPHVANPNTPAQVNQRARMKLMSQLSAALSPVIAMTKEGLVSKRNKFTSRNFDACYVSNGYAQITYENLQLTEGNTALPSLSAAGIVSNSGMLINVGIQDEPTATINRVVYCLFRKTNEGKLEYVDSLIISQRNSSVSQLYFYGGFSNVGVAEYVIYAYGMSDTSERASATYGNLNVVSASDLAKLVATRSISYQDFQFTQTRGITLGADGEAVTPETAGKVRVYVTAVGNGGTVSGGGSFDPGTSVTVVATPETGYAFRRWIYNGTNNLASTDATYTFTANQQTDLVAVFEYVGNDTL